DERVAGAVVRRSSSERYAEESIDHERRVYRETEQRDANELAPRAEAESRDDDRGCDADHERLAAWVESNVQQTQDAAKGRDGDVRQRTHADRVEECHERSRPMTFLRLSSFTAASQPQGEGVPVSESADGLRPTAS